MRKPTLVLVVLVTAMLLGLSGVALAATTQSVPDTGTVQVDGRVIAILAAGDRVYLGGNFTHVDGVARSYLAAVDASTGELTDWNPNANGSVRALTLSADGTRIYVGGAFTTLGGLNRGGLAAVNVATGAVNSTFRPGTFGSTVRTIAVSGNRLYAGGDFTSVNGQRRPRLALVDGTTGSLNPDWTPAADESVRRLVLSADGSRIYVGGGFSTVSGVSRPYLASLVAGTGALDTAFRPPTPNGLVWDLAASGGRVYTAEGGPGGAAAAYDAAKGARVWRDNADGDAQTLTVFEGQVYLGGHFEVFSGQSRRSFAAVDPLTGALDPGWNPRATPSWPGVFALAPDMLRKRLYAGGDFTSISGVQHERFAQFSAQ